MASRLPSFLTFRQFSSKHPAWSEGSLRWLRFNQTTNGLDAAFVSLGRRVFVNEDEFFAAIDRQNGRTGDEAPAA